MKKRVITFSAVAILLQACGGQEQDDHVTFGAQGHIAAKVETSQIQLDQPLKSESIEGQLSNEVFSQHKQSALVFGGTNWSIDTSDREAVRLFFNKVYQADDVPMNWTGDYRSGNPGSVNPAYQEATIKRINWYRAMAGLPIVSNVSDTNSSKNQAAALMMSVNGQLSHHPSSTWKFYTAAGAEAASSSNIALTVNGPKAIDAYISDPGEDNYPVGHRRWLLFPATKSYGTGDVPPATVDGVKFMGANSVWITDTDRSGARPRVRDDFVAWPARGYAPYPVVFSRWSFSYPNADFTGAVVDITRDGMQVQIVQQKVENGYGENTIAWRVSTIPTDLSHGRPETDVKYHVRVSGVRIAQQQRSFEYDVVVFDPAIMATGAAQPQATAPSVAHFGTAYQAQV